MGDDMGTFVGLFLLMAIEAGLSAIITRIDDGTKAKPARAESAVQSDVDPLQVPPPEPSLPGPTPSAPPPMVDTHEAGEIGPGLVQ
ncbi:MAG: hypothetical protein M3Q07_22445 [Pseudobdellovibrionaceae bacterium]|nr:hypothetical protein [Pseudobdellovibrionaceae bacterium]